MGKDTTYLPRQYTTLFLASYFALTLEC